MPTSRLAHSVLVQDLTVAVEFQVLAWTKLFELVALENPPQRLDTPFSPSATSISFLTTPTPAVP